MMTNEMIAHLRESDRQPQTLWEHLEGVSRLCGDFTGEIGMQTTGELLGILHDLGKASQDFQNYLASAIGYLSPDEDGYIDAAAHKGEIDHSTAGAQAIQNWFDRNDTYQSIASQVFSLCIASHHSGLIDCLTPDGENKFEKRMLKPEENAHCTEATQKLSGEQVTFIKRLFAKSPQQELVEKLRALKEDNDAKDTLAFKQGLLIRFLFSCLIDADRLDTADFENPKNFHIRNYGEYRSWDELILRLEAYLSKLTREANPTSVNAIRSQVSDACLNAAGKNKGKFKLGVPTGGGKTLSSLRFGLYHAQKHRMTRIFYIIPYTSIIDQNADEVRKILEDRDASGNYLDRVVLEHHSNLTPEEESRRQNLLAENWDAPVVFTTQVQFLEALFGAGTRNARRMHQLSNAVIIFDEIQTLPVRCVHMFNLAVRFLTQICGSSIVLCTATQPLLDRIDPVARALPIPTENQIIPDEQHLYQALKRVSIIDRRKDGGWTVEEIADLAQAEQQKNGSTLVIVNQRQSARNLYQALSTRSCPGLYHLSTRMCPAHRLEMLATIRGKLDTGQPVLCVSTQLIEAGVDIDFASVIRYLAGLDSIVQAAGRCNRHGLRPSGIVSIVNPEGEDLSRLVDIKIGMEVAQRILNEIRNHPERYQGDPQSLGALEMYYQYYFFNRKGDMSYPVGASSPVGRIDNLFNLLSTNQYSLSEYLRIHHSNPGIPFLQSFQTAGKSFRAIEDCSRGVIVPFREKGKEIIVQLCSSLLLEKEFRLLKTAQRYSVNVRPYEMEQLQKLGAVHEVQKDAGIFYLDEPYYNEQFGWSLDAEQNTDPMIL